MNDSLWVALVNGLVLLALAWIDRRSKARSETTQNKVDELRKNTDGMTDKLIKEVRKSARAQGVKDGTKKPPRKK